MEYVIVAITVIFGAGLTFFSGFGLGTLMLPVFSLFFDIPIAIGATAIVHLSNNIFKFAMVSKYIHFPTLWKFGIPATLLAAAGGGLLSYFDYIPIIGTYEINERVFTISYVKIIIGSLMIFFAWFDLDPRFDNLKIKEEHLPIGGMLSGFFGGISGHQGAFRATFLSKANITKEQLSGLPLYHNRKSKTITMAIFRTDGTTETITLPTREAWQLAKQEIGEYQSDFNRYLSRKIVYCNKACSNHGNP